MQSPQKKDLPKNSTPATQKTPPKMPRKNPRKFVDNYPKELLDRLARWD